MANRQSRFGIGEWYGRPFTELSTNERRRFAEIQFLPAAQRPSVPCPFLSSSDRTVGCWKAGGVCSLRRYDLLASSGQVVAAEAVGPLRTTCPSRFEEQREIYRWIGEIVLGQPQAVPIGQINFLERVPLTGQEGEESGTRGEVGRIDNVLVVPGTTPLQWCTVEIQAVYFSGDSMDRDFAAIRSFTGAGIAFPAGRRRPDYRSSGPKRLMPQLQIKVPTLRRWGKKMAVVVDEAFFGAMGRLSIVDDMSNCDVAWFVVRFDEDLRLRRANVYMSTLEESVQSLVAGRPVSLSEFEQRILTKLSRVGPSPVEAPSDE